MNSSVKVSAVLLCERVEDEDREMSSLIKVFSVIHAREISVVLNFAVFVQYSADEGMHVIYVEMKNEEGKVFTIVTFPFDGDSARTPRQLVSKQQMPFNEGRYSIRIKDENKAVVGESTFQVLKS